MSHFLSSAVRSRRHFRPITAAHTACLALGAVLTGCVPVLPNPNGDQVPDETDLTCKCQEDLQVTLEVRFVVAEDSFLEDIGVDIRGIFDTTDGNASNARYGPGPFVGETASFLSATADERDFVIESLLPPNPDRAEGLSLIGSFLDDTEFNAVINAIRDEESPLSAPAVTTSFGQSASIVISNETQFLNDYETDFQTALTNIDELINPVFTGPGIEVTPRVDEDNTIIMDIRPTAIGIFNTPDSPDWRPMVRGSNVTTTIRLNDGQTVLIAGVTDDSGTTTDSTVPWLGNVPLISRTFQNQRYVQDDSTLLVLVTARILRGDDEP